MKNKYTASLNPFSIGTGFLLAFLMLIALPKTGQYLLVRYYPSIFEYYGDYVYNGVAVLTWVVLLLGVPILRNKKKSLFEQNRLVLSKYDGMGTIQGLRGAIFRILVYEDGIEIRAFYNTYFIPFSEIKNISIEDAGYLSKRLMIKATIPGIPDYIDVAKDENKFWNFVESKILIRQE